MEIWLDSINLDLIVKAKNIGLLYGITTNPAILSESKDIESTLTALLESQEGPITCQVTVNNTDAMIQQGLAYEKISDRIIVKVPVTQQGLEAIHHLSERDIDTMATIIYNCRQYLLAAKAGAIYAAPYFSSIIKSGGDAESEIVRMVEMKERYDLQTKILVASIQNLPQLETCLDLGVDAVTLKDTVFLQFIEDNPFTLDRINTFLKA